MKTASRVAFIDYVMSMKFTIFLLSIIIIVLGLSTVLALEGFFQSIFFYGLMGLLFLNLFFCVSRSLPSFLIKLLSAPMYIFSKQGARMMGIHFIHISILLIIFFSVVKHFVETDQAIRISENTTYVLPRGVASIYLNDFKVIYDKAGNVQRYVSDVMVKKKDKPLTRAYIEVNHPLSIEGYEFFQMSYGKEFHLVVGRLGKSSHYKLQEGSSIPFSGKDRLLLYAYFNDFSGGNGFNSNNISRKDNNPVVWLIIPGDVPTSILLKLHETVQLGSQTISFSSMNDFTVLRRIKDPTLIWMAGALIIFCIGIIVTFYTPRRNS